MTPADLQDSMTRQGLSARDIARLVYSSRSMVHRWVKGVHKVPGGVQAFLELRDYHEPGGSDEMREGLELLRYCKDRDLNLKRAKRAIRELLLHRKLGPWRRQKSFQLRRRMAKWGI